MRLTHGLHRGRQQYPDTPATIDGERMRTWRESADRVARLAGGLRALGLQPGGRIAVWALNSDAYHELLLAAAWAGGVFVPLNTRWSPGEAAFALRDCDATMLAVDDSFADAPEGLAAEGPCPCTLLYTGRNTAPAGMMPVEALVTENRPATDAERGGSDLAGIYYTGGTTGRSKGVMLSHASMVSSTLMTAAAGGFVAPGARYLHAAPMFHTADASGWMAVNALGGTHVFMPRISPASVLRAIERHRVTDVIMVPTMVGVLAESPDSADADLSSLERLLYGGAPMPAAVLRQTMDRFPAVAFAQAYSMTEMSPITLLTDEDHDVERLRSSVGRALPYVDIRIADEEGNDMPPGVVGEVLARGSGQMLGYWNQPEATATAMRGGWMHTGDAGYLSDDGYLYVVDRLEDIIITGGESVYSAEVENALATHPAVASCAVIGLPDPDRGERVHAVVVLSDGASATAADALKAHVTMLIEAYKVPQTIDIASSLPLAGAGKVLKQTLREEYRAATDD